MKQGTGDIIILAIYANTPVQNKQKGDKGAYVI